MDSRFFERVKHDPVYLERIKENPSARFPELAALAAKGRADDGV